MATTSDHASLADALLAFQAELPHVGKDNEADTGKFKYKYVDLTTLTDIALPLLNKHGMSWSTWPNVNEHGAVLTYMLTFGKEQQRGSYPLGAANQPPQSLGSAITYARRYALCAVTGIAPGGDDDDAQVAQTPPAPTVDPIVVTEWVEQFNSADSIPALQALWEEAGKSGVTKDPKIATAKDAAKKRLA